MGGGEGVLSYFNIAPKLNKSFALMHPDFESNLITHIFRKFGVSGTTGRDVIIAFVKGTQGVLCNFDHNACLSVRVFYSLHRRSQGGGPRGPPPPNQNTTNDKKL